MAAGSAIPSSRAIGGDRGRLWYFRADRSSPSYQLQAAPEQAFAIRTRNPPDGLAQPSPQAGDDGFGGRQDLQGAAFPHAAEDVLHVQVEEAVFRAHGDGFHQAEVVPQVCDLVIAHHGLPVGRNGFGTQLLAEWPSM